MWTKFNDREEGKEQIDSGEKKIQQRLLMDPTTKGAELRQNE